MAIRLTESRLRQIIREEASRLTEMGPSEGGAGAVSNRGYSGILQPYLSTVNLPSFMPEELATIYKVGVLMYIMSDDDVFHMNRSPGDVHAYPQDPLNQVQGLRYNPNPINGNGTGFEFMMNLSNRLRKFNIKGATTGKRTIDSIMGPGFSDSVKSWWGELNSFLLTHGGRPVPDFGPMESIDLDGAIQQLQSFQGSAASKKAAARGTFANAGRRAHTDYMSDIKKYGR